MATTGALAELVAASGLSPQTALVLGSGLAEVADAMTVAARAPMDGLVGLRAAAVAGQAREVLIGELAGCPIILFLGRYHLYQGLTAEQIAAPVAALAGTGVRRVILTNAAGGINADFQVGDLMLVRDHLNLPGLAGFSPLIPPPSDAVAFVPMRGAYSPVLRRQAREAAGSAGVRLREGVYAMVAGPSYETAAELAMLRTLGADAVAMSMMPEVVMARTLGLDVLAISTITNRAVPEEEASADHAEVLREGKRAAASLTRLLSTLLPRL